jgi:hypothetical protein
MKKQEVKCCGSIKRRGGISSHDIHDKRVDMDQATPCGSRDKNSKTNEDAL